MFRKIRIIVLLLVLASVAQSAWLAKSRATDWKSSLQVAVYPISGDSSPVAHDYIGRLRDDHFDAIEDFMQEQAGRYGITVLRPVDVALAPRIATLPPVPPGQPNPLSAALYSLKLRYWAWRANPGHQPTPQAKLYVIYHDPNRTAAVAHSLGLEKGMIGVVHAFAARSYTQQNNVVITHELLHTLGATDKYHPATNQPRYPDGYAHPERIPLYPQERAEIMGGRTPLSPAESMMPASLEETVIGPLTAREINWIKR